MANAVITNIAKKKMLRARAGVEDLSSIVGFCFGDGGVDSSGNVISPSANQISLNNELYRKEIDKFEFTSDTECRYICTLSGQELVGKSISEIALYDSDGDLVAINNFTSKGKDADLEMTFQIDDTFEDGE